MELHRAQNFKNAVVSHLPGLFRKTSDMDWEHRRKVVVHVLDDDVRQIQFKVGGKVTDAFINSIVCFVGVRYGEGRLSRNLRLGAGGPAFLCLSWGNSQAKNNGQGQTVVGVHQPSGTAQVPKDRGQGNG